nr:polysaccharide deacetylase family protein [uncultured Gellertiella sp.]
MTLSEARLSLTQSLDRWQHRGAVARLWLRDDDAVEPTPALRHFLATIGDLPATLAVIPERTGLPLVRFLENHPGTGVALHGWSHANHAGVSEKKQELGSHRPVAMVLAELRDGFDKLCGLHGDRFIPMLVPPWNRISVALLSGLPGLGITCLSVFGPEGPGPLPMLNTHVDVMDWHGTRGGRDCATLLREVAARLDSMGATGTMGVLTHHLVHDHAVDIFLKELIAATAGHPACRWISATEAIASLRVCQGKVESGFPAQTCLREKTNENKENQSLSGSN